VPRTDAAASTARAARTIQYRSAARREGRAPDRRWASASAKSPPREAAGAGCRSWGGPEASWRVMADMRDSSVRDGADAGRLPRVRLSSSAR
jgi:hypothetical protein